ncbi:MAG: CvpA family protein, partial [Bacteroidota bacterium]
MLLDIIAIGLLIFAIYKGLRKGLIVALFSFIAFIVGLAAALKLSAVAAGYIGQAVSISDRWLPVIAFFLVFFIVV